MGEKDFDEKAVVKSLNSAVQEMERAAQELYFSTPGGRFHVCRDENGSTTALCQLAFFC